MGILWGRRLDEIPARHQFEGAVPGGAQEQAATVELNPQLSAEEAQGPPPVAAVVVEQPKEREQEPLIKVAATREPDIVDITSLLGAPTVIVVRSTL